MNWFGPSGDCGCCDQYECREVATVTFTSSDACLTPFMGTWTMTTTGMPASTCLRDCRSYFTSALVSGNCTPAGTTYSAYGIGAYALAFTTGVIIIHVQFTWLEGPGFFITRQLTGTFTSTDNGATFGAFVIDDVPAGCPTISSDGPTSGSDLTCTVT